MGARVDRYTCQVKRKEHGAGTLCFAFPHHAQKLPPSITRITRWTRRGKITPKGKRKGGCCFFPTNEDTATATETPSCVREKKGGEGSTPFLMHISINHFVVHRIPFQHFLFGCRLTPMQLNQIGLLFALLSLSGGIMALDSPAQTELRQGPDLKLNLKSARPIEINRHWVVSQKNASRRMAKKTCRGYVL